MLIRVKNNFRKFSTLKKSWKKEELNDNKANVYIKSTKRNIFCTLMDLQSKKVKTSCSLRVPQYENEFNQRESLYDRGVLLGELFGNKAKELGYKEIFIYLDFGLNKARKGVIMGLRKEMRIVLIRVSKSYPHNGCRPPKRPRKKIRTKPKK